MRCFANVAEHLTDDGVFVMEAFTPGYLHRLRDHQYVDAEEIRVDKVWLDVARHDPVDPAAGQEPRLADHGGIELNPVVLRYAWPSELDLMARLAGLALQARWGGWERRPFDAGAGCTSRSGGVAPVTDAEATLELARRYRDAFFARDIDEIMSLQSRRTSSSRTSPRASGSSGPRRRAVIYGDPRALARPAIRGGPGGGSWPATGQRGYKNGRRGDAGPTPDAGIEWDGMDLILVRDGRIARNAVYSSGHAAREIG